MSICHMELTRADKSQHKWNFYRMYSKWMAVHDIVFAREGKSNKRLWSDFVIIHAFYWFFIPPVLRDIMVFVV